MTEELHPTLLDNVGLFAALRWQVTQIRARCDIIRAAIRDYRYPRPGDYRIWPGPNSNTFVAAVMQAAAIKAALPTTAIGKDFPYDGRWVGFAPSRTGVRLNLGGYVGIMLGWYEGIEVNILGLVAGVDLRRPALKLPGLGRLGFPLQTSPGSQSSSFSSD